MLVIERTPSIGTVVPPDVMQDPTTHRVGRGWSATAEAAEQVGDNVVGFGKPAGADLTAGERTG